MAGPSIAEIRTGARFRLDSEPVTTRQLVMYAGASGDFNPIHYDLPHAQSAGLGGVIAHGMLTMAMSGRSVTEWAGPSGLVTEIGGRFLTPVRPGQVVTFEGTVEEADIDARGAGTCRLKVDGRVGEQAVYAGFATVRFNGLLPASTG